MREERNKKRPDTVFVVNARRIIIEWILLFACTIDKPSTNQGLRGISVRGGRGNEDSGTFPAIVALRKILID